MNFQQLLLILRARYQLALSTLAGTIAATLIISWLLPAHYTATTSVVVDVKSPDPIAGMVLPAMAMPGYMATQVDIINSDRVAYRVIRTMRLDENPAVLESWREDTGGRGSVQAWLTELLHKKLDVRPARESNVITINFKATDARFAATVANAFAQAYIDTNIELKVEPAKQYAGWFEKRSRELRDKLEAAQTRLSQYQQSNGLVAADERLDFENQKLNELQTQLVIAETQSADAGAKQRTGGTETLPEVMQSGLIQQLKADRARLEAKRQEAAGNLGRNHPQYQRFEAEVAALDRQLADETRRIASSIGTSTRISRGKEAELRGAIGAHKQRILELKRQRDEAMVLQKDVEAAQKAYDAVTQRVAQSTLESQSTQTNVSVLTPADEPLEPSSPKLLLNTVLAIFLGAFLGIVGALLAELLDRRVRSSEDLEPALELPLLAEFRPPAGNRPGSLAGRLAAWLPGRRQPA